MRVTFTAVFLFITISGCSIAENQSTLKKTGLPEEFFNTEWQLIQIFDSTADPIDQPKATLIFGWEENRIFGTNGCNRFSGAYLSGDEKRLTFLNTISTQIACNTSGSDDVIPDSLNQVTHFSLSKDFTTLHLLNSNGDLLLTFRKEPLERI